MKKKDIKFLNKYFDDFKDFINFNADKIKEKLFTIKKIVTNTKKGEKKYLFLVMVVVLQSQVILVLI